MVEIKEEGEKLKEKAPHQFFCLQILSSPWPSGPTVVFWAECFPAGRTRLRLFPWPLISFGDVRRWPGFSFACSLLCPLIRCLVEKDILMYHQIKQMEEQESGDLMKLCSAYSNAGKTSIQFTLCIHKMSKVNRNNSKNKWTTGWMVCLAPVDHNKGNLHLKYFQQSPVMHQKALWSLYSQSQI